MLLPVAALALPPLLIFGIYHLVSWTNPARAAARSFPRRLALASAMSHLLMALGFVVFMWLDYRASLGIGASPAGFETFLVSRPGFWRVVLVFDTLPGVLLAGIFGTMARLDWQAGSGFLVVAPVVLAAGTLQWYAIGAAVGAVWERVWVGLKTPDDDLPDWM